MDPSVSAANEITPPTDALDPAPPSEAPADRPGSRVAAEPVLHVPGIYRDPTSCFECGLCCKMLQVVLDRRESEVHRAWYQEIHGDARSAEDHFFSDPARSDYRMNMKADRCGFLEEGNRCAIHRLRGGLSKSSACRSFPVTSLQPTPRGTFAGLAFYCPDVARSLLDSSAPLMRTVAWDDKSAAPIAFVAAGGSLPWPIVLEYLGFVREIVENSVYSISDALLLVASETMRRWTRTGSWAGGSGIERTPASLPRMRHWLRAATVKSDYMQAGIRRAVEVFALDGAGRRVAERIETACDLFQIAPTRAGSAASVGAPVLNLDTLLSSHPDWDAALRRYLIYKLHDLKVLETFGPWSVNVLALASFALCERLASLCRSESTVPDPFQKSTMITDYLLFSSPLSILRDPDFVPLLKHPNFAAFLLG